VPEDIESSCTPVHEIGFTEISVVGARRHHRRGDGRPGEDQASIIID
jgi:hypothetical protein